MTAKATDLRQELEALGAEESQLRSRIKQLKLMVEEKKNRLESLEKLKAEEAALLATLG